MVRFVALGDSLTEGVGDPMSGCPNGLRGWADVLAAGLERACPGSDYANLALRGKRAADVLAEQVGAGLTLRPDLVTVWAGGNDVLRPAVRVETVAASLGHTVEEAAGAGATVVVLTGIEVAGSVALRPVRARVAALGAHLRRLAGMPGVRVVDLGGPSAWADPRWWAPDRVHPSASGHQSIASVVGRHLGIGVEAPAPPGPLARAARRDRLRSEVAWWADHALPHLGRWATNASSRERVVAKYPVPVRPSAVFPW